MQPCALNVIKPCNQHKNQKQKCTRPNIFCYILHFYIFPTFYIVMIRDLNSVTLQLNTSDYYLYVSHLRHLSIFNFSFMFIVILYQTFNIYHNLCIGTDLGVDLLILTIKLK